MDFRTCPACQSSVLEDDVTECPFCGASMSGKPKPKAAAPKPAAAPAAPAKPAAAAPAAPVGKAPAGRSVPPQRPRTEPAAAAEDPFDVDTTAVRRAIKLAPRPTKQRTLEVVCPMCETPGYLTPTDSGKDVQCCNPECIVPVFKSKRVAIKDEAPPPPQRNWVLWGGMGAGAVIVAGVATWLLLGKQPETVGPSRIDPVVIEEKRGNDLVPPNERVIQQGPKVLTLGEIRKESLVRMVDSAKSREHNRNAEYGWQLVSESQSQAGDVTAAAETLAQMQKNARAEPSFQVIPLVELGWQQLAAGQNDALKTTLDSALAKAANLPKTVRRTQDIVIALSTLLIAADRIPEATALIDKHNDFEVRGTLATLWRTALESKSFNVQLEGELPWHAAMPDPLRIAIAECLVLRGQPAKALAWLKSLPGIPTRDACRAAWAGRLLQKHPEKMAEVTAELTQPEMTPAAQCRVLAAAGYVLAQAGDAENAKARLAEAVKQLDALTPAEPLPVPDLRAVFDSDKKERLGLPDPGPVHSQALAALDVALLQLALKDKDAVFASFQKAHLLARGMSPGPAATQKLVNDSKNEATIRSQLQAAFRMSDADVRLAFYKYGRQAQAFDALADSRLAWQARFLKLAAHHGLLAQTWDFIKQVDAESDINRKDPLLAQPELIGNDLLAWAQGTEQTELAAQLKAHTTPVRFSADPLVTAEAKGKFLIEQQKFPAAAEPIQPFYRGQAAGKQPDEIDAAALRIVGQVQQSADLKQQLAFAQLLNDPVLQEEAHLLIAGTSVRRQFAPELWTLVTESKDLEPLDRVGIYRALVSAIPVNAP